jgi:uncharacterized membrane protein
MNAQKNQLTFYGTLCNGKAALLLPLYFERRTAYQNGQEVVHITVTAYASGMIVPFSCT